MLVVDNAPSDDRTATLVAGYADAPWPVDYVREPRPGLSFGSTLTEDGVVAAGEAEESALATMFGELRAAARVPLDR